MNLADRLFRATSDHVQTVQRITALEARVERLEDRLFSYYKCRWEAVDKLADYLVGAELDGDYMEFGVFQGTTFTYAYQHMAHLFQRMKFVAFDSFEGLPEPTGVDLVQGYTSGFHAGQFRCDEECFRANLALANVDLARCSIIKGWFSDSLEQGNPALDSLQLCASAWIDCDLYESTTHVLQFLTDRLTLGSVLLFDDWRCFKNLPNFGQQRACDEWLRVNPNIKLAHLFEFGFHGIAFSVASC